ncbi:hypothetical protein TBLA_0B07870 [Henningerozyma blattae CBS 6284]|uniref:DNA repair protein RAD2 n=1 Tax=Henningerozyma blattae (strain ATCC 34711 / CBS 6284 / DSM 70876 / NBRC 10599 / NRRL Y-10934 / UCD 77-7) TaxID=1071380 RepID=I2GZQ1_HENB6|nr:hypothetical protein TBLA_0B07870 [Tetrapisispora blattae CBS 6284]CCH59603.1 hypothetical protein TBLA_0B07870 [Tetrapisispora blattae CBS 6284]
MGVHSFWDIVNPTAKPVRLDSLQDKKMAVDASIWIYQFLKAVRDDQGNAVKNAHIVGFFRRICKLLYFGIKPVFIFDGGVPVLKKNTIKKRKERRQGKRDNAAATAKKLLAVQLQKKINDEVHPENLSAHNAESATVASKNKSYTLQDEWQLPELSGFHYDEDDQRVMPTETFENVIKSIDDELDHIDLDSINPASKEFEELPKSSQYLILSTLRLRSRLRMGYTKEQLEQMFPDSLDFSKFQIDMVRRRNFFTQKLINTTGLHDGGASKLTDDVIKRISGKNDKEYKLTKTENGWTLGFGEFDGTEAKKAINLEPDSNSSVLIDRKYDLKKLFNTKSIGLTNSNSDIQNDINNNNNINNSNNDAANGNEENDDDEEEEDFEWEDVDVIPKKKEQIEDFSINAARLSHTQKLKNVNENSLRDNNSIAGSQAFLDKRYVSNKSPLKVTPSKLSYYIIDEYEQEESSEHNSNNSRKKKFVQKEGKNDIIINKSLNKIKRKINFENDLLENSMDPNISMYEKQHTIRKIESPSNTITSNSMKIISPHDSEDDDYLDQLKEIEMIEDFQTKKLEAKKCNIQDLPKRKEDISIDTKIDNKRLPLVTHFSNMPSTMEVPLTENQQNLNFIVSKIPDFSSNGVSFLFQNNVPKETQDTRSTKPNKKPHMEVPSWFENSSSLNSNQQYNPYSTTEFVHDRAEEQQLASNGTEKRHYDLVSGFTAEQLLEKIKCEPAINAKHVVDSDNSLEVIENSNSLVSKSEDDNDLEIIEPKANAEIKNIKNNENTSLSTEPLITYQEPVGKPVDSTLSINYNTQSKNIHSESESNNMASKPMVFDYDFSEDEEDEISENIRKENDDFNDLRNKLQGDNERVTGNAFLEDELFEQQMKDKRDSDEVTTDMILDVQELLSRFGIPFITAPMEAEAQCAELINLKLVDGIVTDDSDVFLFGGTKVYKNMFHEKHYVEYYDNDVIFRNLGLDREYMIELVELLGSDYTTGIKGMGPVSSMEVLAEFGNLKNFKEWYNEGQFDKSKQEKENKFQKDLRKKLVKNGVIFENDFPNSLVSDAYMNPEVDHDSTAFKWGVPDLDMLRTFMRNKIGWQKEKSDEILIPLIRTINQRKIQQKQRTLNEFFPNEVLGQEKRYSASNRMSIATSKLKKRRLK